MSDEQKDTFIGVIPASTTEQLVAEFSGAVAVVRPKRERLTRRDRLRLAAWHFRCAWIHLWKAVRG